MNNTSEGKQVAGWIRDIIPNEELQRSLSKRPIVSRITQYNSKSYNSKNYNTEKCSFANQVVAAGPLFFPDFSSDLRAGPLKSPFIGEV